MDDVILQRTPDWLLARAGKVTASRIGELMAKTKTGYAASRQNYLAQLIAERLSGMPQEGFVNAAIQWGTDTEPLARAAYENHRDCFVDEVGFLTHPEIINSGASPDGLVEEQGLIEIKCPNTATHIETLLGAGIPRRYLLQMSWQMACSGRSWCDFVSFDPRLPEPMQLFIWRYERDNALIAEIESEVRVFLAELDTAIHRIMSMRAPLDAVAASDTR
jgi:putative phage-type endonuclease